MKKSGIEIIELIKQPSFLAGALVTGALIEWLSRSAAGPQGFVGFLLSLVLFLIITALIEYLYSLTFINKKK